MDEKLDVIIEKNNNILIVRPNGRMDSITAPELSGKIEAELDGVDEIIMDLAQVDYISSAGLRLMLDIMGGLDDVNGRMKLVHVRESIRSVLEMTGFLDYVTVEEDADPALTDGISGGQDINSQKL